MHNNYPKFIPKTYAWTKPMKEVIADLHKYDIFTENRPLNVEVFLRPEKFELLKKYSQGEIDNVMIYENPETGRQLIVKRHR